MKIDILTLFPRMFDGFLSESIIARAINDNYVSINIHNIRDYSLDPHKRVDDYQFGGGAGMVLMPEPIFEAVDALRTPDSKIFLMTPQGKVYNQQLAYQFKDFKHIIIICGHYEGFDERIRTLADYEISVGDYVVTGGELPSMIVTDSIVRLINGVICEESHLRDSHTEFLLDYPVYTKPVSFRGMDVPEVLLSGHHANIDKFRKEEQIKRTRERRGDLLERYYGKE